MTRALGLLACATGGPAACGGHAADTPDLGRGDSPDLGCHDVPEPEAKLPDCRAPSATPAWSVNFEFPDDEPPDFDRWNFVYNGQAEVDAARTTATTLVLQPSGPDTMLARIAIFADVPAWTQGLKVPLTLGVSEDSPWWTNSVVQLVDADGLVLTVLDGDWSVLGAGGLSVTPGDEICLGMADDTSPTYIPNAAHRVAIGLDGETWEMDRGTSETHHAGGHDFAVSVETADTVLDWCTTDQPGAWIRLIAVRQQ